MNRSIYDSAFHILKTQNEMCGKLEERDSKAKEEYNRLGIGNIGGYDFMFNA